MPLSKGAPGLLVGCYVNKLAIWTNSLLGRPLKGPQHSVVVKLDLEGDTRLATSPGAPCPLSAALVSGPVQESTFNAPFR